jgi:probable rRNA maturation factor
MNGKRRRWRVDIQLEHRGYTLERRRLAALVRAILREFEDQAPADSREVSLVFTGDQQIQALNAAYRAKNRPTDVLSFSQLEGEGAPGECLGDIVISLDTAARQAAERGLRRDPEILRLLIHGLLHLLGYDHVRVPRSEVRRMQAREDELYERFLPQAKGLSARR